MLYAFGSNGSGQLGVGHEDDLSQPQSSIIDSLDSIKQIAAGGNHTLFLSETGKVAAAGNNPCGHTARAEGDSVSHCTAVPASLPAEQHSGGEWNAPVLIDQVAATWCASLMLSRHGSLIVGGEGLNGELGLGKDITKSTDLQAIPNFPPGSRRVLQIAACMAHAVAVLDNGDVYGWGKGGKGQLGEPAQDAWSPRKIEGIPFPVAKAVCGKDFTCFIGARENGELAISGLKSRDRFGVLSSAPKAVPGWKDVGASWGSIFILKQDGNLISFGRNDHGQLAPQDLPAVEAIGAGSEHCLALTQAGQVLSWGWGEHGNCGAPTDQSGDVKGGRWNEVELPDGQSAAALFAGCATSFIVAADEQG